MNSAETNIADVDTILKTYSDTVYKIALVRTGSKFDADDVFQEVFIRLIKHFNKIQSAEHAKHWLIRVTINCSLKHIKIWRDPNSTDITKLVLDVPFTPEETGLYEALMRIPPKYRTVIHLYYYEGYSISEISDILKTKEGTVKSLLSRGRKKLEFLLGEEFGDDFK